MLYGSYVVDDELYCGFEMFNEIVNGDMGLDVLLTYARRIGVGVEFKLECPVVDTLCEDAFSDVIEVEGDASQIVWHGRECNCYRGACKKSNGVLDVNNSP